MNAEYIISIRNKYIKLLEYLNPNVLTFTVPFIFRLHSTEEWL